MPPFFVPRGVIAMLCQSRRILRQRKANAMQITLELAKAHLRLPPDFADDDKLITAYITAAEQEVAARLCEKLEDIAPGGEWDERLAVAVLLLVAHYYDHRSDVEAVRTYPVGEGVQRLLNLYRDYAK